MGLVKKTLEWCKGRNSLLVRILPIGFILAFCWGGKNMLFAGEYITFAWWTLVCGMIGLAVVAVPHLLLSEEQGKSQKCNNLDMLLGELFLLYGFVAWLLD